MGRANVGNNTDVGSADLGQTRNFTGAVGPQLNNGPGMPGVQPEQRQGKSNVVVIIAPR